ncbi:MAG: hypothetical protein IPJ03_16970 [Ignavibacteriales bacterium]|nr:hypothetical protein [Ignavibacteriales bacterium]
MECQRYHSPHRFPRHKRASDNAGVNTFNSQGGALGSEYQFLVNLLKGNIDKGNPLINQIFSTGKNAILSSGETARKSASEALASSGLYGSGAGAGVNTQIAGQEGQALKELNLGTQTNQVRLFKPNDK